MMEKQIKELIFLQQHLAKQALSEYSGLVDHIIIAQSTDQNYIEHTLDGMLDFCFDADMLLLFKKLCRYYFTINPQATAFYINHYREMWDSDSIDNKEMAI
ncbi:MAG: hypothetical protein NTX61_08725 [Bacteroidetes bacterium]|nr:hypothetical protein [Bacteroidota bacterium]